MTFSPDAPGAPVLDPSSDSGTKGDNVTNVTTQLLFNVSVATAGDTVELFRNGTLVGSRIGPGPIADPGPVQPDGVYVYTAQQMDQSGTISQPSPPLSVTIVTKASAPTQVRLNASSDSGTQGDNVTNVTTNLQIDVFGVTAGATLILLRNGVPVAQIAGTTGGKVTIADPGPLVQGTYNYSAAQVDGAGNTSTAQPLGERPGHDGRHRADAVARPVLGHGGAGRRRHHGQRLRRRLPQVRRLERDRRGDPEPAPQRRGGQHPLQCPGRNGRDQRPRDGDPERHLLLYGAAERLQR